MPGRTLLPCPCAAPQARPGGAAAASLAKLGASLPWQHSLRAGAAQASIAVPLLTHVPASPPPVCPSAAACAC
jgi:hypothetical protein